MDAAKPKAEPRAVTRDEYMHIQIAANIQHGLSPETAWEVADLQWRTLPVLGAAKTLRQRVEAACEALEAWYTPGLQPEIPGWKPRVAHAEGVLQAVEAIRAALQPTGRARPGRE